MAYNLNRFSVVEGIVNKRKGRTEFEAVPYRYATMNPVQPQEVERREAVARYNATHVGQMLDVSLKVVDLEDFRSVYEAVGFRGLLENDENVQGALYNFVSNMALYAYKTRLRIVNSARNTVPSQDLQDVVSDSYARVRSALLEYSQIDVEDRERNRVALENRMATLSGRELYEARKAARMAERKSVVGWYVNKLAMDTFNSEENDGVPMTTTNAMVQDLQDGITYSPEMDWNTFKYVVAVLVGQIYDVYLYRIGRALRSISLDTIYGNDGTELNSMSGVIDRISVISEEAHRAQADAEAFMYYAKEVCDVYFANHKPEARARFESLALKVKDQSYRMSPAEQSQWYRMKTRIMEYIEANQEQLYADYFG